jgi:hypothetical protein
MLEPLSSQRTRLDRRRHRATRLALVPTIAKAASLGQRVDVAETAGRIRVGVGPQR